MFISHMNKHQRSNLGHHEALKGELSWSYYVVLYFRERFIWR